jgi:hypothetical protein
VNSYMGVVICNFLILTSKQSIIRQKMTDYLISYRSFKSTASVYKESKKINFENKEINLIAYI